MGGNKEEYKRFTISLSQKLFKEFESFRKKKKWGRSDGIRKAMRAFMISEENIADSSGYVVGCITMIMSHEHIKQLDKPLKDNNFKHFHEFDQEHDYAREHLHEHDYSSKSIYANVQQTDSLLSIDIQHHFGDIIISTLHIHLEFEKCMEIIAVSGPYERVKSLRDRLQKLKSVLSIGFFVVDKGENTKK